jgi:NADH-quinone oxidoreductase subunit A
VSDFLRAYLLVAIFGGTAGLLVASVLGLGRLIRPSRPNREKLTTYESGVDPVGSAYSQSQVRYYIFALLFVLFDVEAVFIFPWAMHLEAFGYFGLVEMGIFVFILVLGLAYAWRKGVLRWV